MEQLPDLIYFVGGLLIIIAAIFAILYLYRNYRKRQAKKNPYSFV